MATKLLLDIDHEGYLTIAPLEPGNSAVGLRVDTLAEIWAYCQAHADAEHLPLHKVKIRVTKAVHRASEFTDDSKVIDLARSLTQVLETEH